MARLHRGLTPNRLRWLLASLWLAIALPSAVLIWQAQRQLKWEAFVQHQILAAELADRIDQNLARWLATEQERGFADYQFLTVLGDTESNYLQPSPLSALPVDGDLPGLIGYFQVDAQGRFSTPLLPDDPAVAARYGLSPEQVRQRRQRQETIRRLLAENQLVQTAATEADALARGDIGGLKEETDTAGAGRDAFAGEPQARSEVASAPVQQAFDQLADDEGAANEQRQQLNKLGQLEDLKLRREFEEKAAAERSKPALKSKTAPAAAPSPTQSNRSRKEQVVVAESAEEPDRDASPGYRVSTFAGEIDPFEFALLGSGHFVLYRNVWRDGQRYIQGALIEQSAFINGGIERTFRTSALSRMSNLVVAYGGDVLDIVAGRAERDISYQPDAQLHGELLYQTRLSAPLSRLQLLWTINRLPAGPGGAVLGWTAAVLFLVLSAGLYLVYRLGLRQIELTRQQQDFVSAVSHELKTPLTSIRMYGEMLREGWVGEDKRREYYDFIHDESERLSRLIANVLQLARLERNGMQLELRSVTVGELLDLLRSKLDGTVRRAGFECRFDCQADCEDRQLQVDTDAFIQILINLTDNAIKFAASAETRRVDIQVRCPRPGEVIWSVRDYGPGVPKAQMKKIFRLFYRAENELTRETVGTGIGLSLVQQLARGMGGSVDVVNREPGAEFRVTLPAA